MPTKKQASIQHLLIPIEGDDAKSSARTLRKHLLSLQQLALGGIRDTDDLTIRELEALRGVTDLMIRLQEIEEQAAKPETPP
jgi:hypothetical protein